MALIGIFTVHVTFSNIRDAPVSVVRSFIGIRQVVLTAQERAT